MPLRSPRPRVDLNKYPEGDAPADRMERLALLLRDLSADVKDLANELREEATHDREGLSRPQ